MAGKHPCNSIFPFSSVNRSIPLSSASCQKTRPIGLGMLASSSCACLEACLRLLAPAASLLAPPPTGRASYISTASIGPSYCPVGPQAMLIRPFLLHPCKAMLKNCIDMNDTLFVHSALSSLWLEQTSKGTEMCVFISLADTHYDGNLCPLNK